MNLDQVFQLEVKKEEARLVNGVDGRTIMAICRSNYDLWVDKLFPSWAARRMNCHEEIARIFRENGYPHAKKETIKDCMTRLHKEKGLNKTKARRRGLGVTLTPVTLPVESVPGAVAEVVPAMVRADQSGSRPWADPSWIGEEPNWRVAIPALLKDLDKGLPAWSDDLENVWRHLYRLADERKFTPMQRSTSVGFQTIGADFANLWVGLSNLRRRLGMNPKGV